MADSRAWVYGWAAAVVDRLGRRQLHQLAQVHHRHHVRDVAHHRQVVGDEHVGQAQAVLQVLEQVDDTGLDRDVEGGNGLVQDDQRRLERQCPGHTDPLALTA